MKHISFFASDKYNLNFSSLLKQSLQFLFKIIVWIKLVSMKGANDNIVMKFSVFFGTFITKPLLWFSTTFAITG